MTGSQMLCCNSRTLLLAADIPNASIALGVTSKSLEHQRDRQGQMEAEGDLDKVEVATGDPVPTSAGSSEQQREKLIEE